MVYLFRAGHPDYSSSGEQKNDKIDSFSAIIYMHILQPLNAHEYAPSAFQGKSLTYSEHYSA